MVFQEELYQLLKRCASYLMPGWTWSIATLRFGFAHLHPLEDDVVATSVAQYELGS
jgi:hypothetical protein